jgi:hypothetical protein
MMTEPEATARALAPRYLWWRRDFDFEIDLSALVAQVMDIGDFHDTQVLLGRLGPGPFVAVLREARPGALRPKSWTYWHYKLGVTPFDQEPPPIPTRTYE